MEFWPLAIALATVFFGSVLKGAMGMGLPLLAVPVLAAVMGLPDALLLIAVPMMFTNLWQVYEFRHARGDVPMLIRFLIGGIPGLALGLVLLIWLPQRVMELSVAVVVLAALALQIAKPQLSLPRPQADRLAPLAGVLAGILHGAVGLSGFIGVSYFLGLRLPRPALMLSVASMFLLFSLLQSLTLLTSGIGSTVALTYGLVSLPVTPFGMAIGRSLAKRLSDQVFRLALIGTVGVSCLLIVLR